MPKLRSSYNLLFERDVTDGDIDRLYRRMPAAHGVAKYTRAERFRSFDLSLRAIIDECFEPGRPIRVHDMAASNGITSLELRDCLAETREVSVRASDYFHEIRRVRVFGLDVFFDVDGKPIETALAQRVIPFQSRRLFEMAGRRLASADRRPLFHPAALASVGPTFSVARDDIFAPAPGSYDVVRVMNTLIPAMGRESIQRALGAILPTVAEGGLFVVGRNTPEGMDAAIFWKNGGAFELREKIGRGFAESEMILQPQ